MPPPERNQAETIREFLLRAAPGHPADLAPFTAKVFGVTLPTVHRHLNRLIREGKVLKTGQTRGTRYFLKGAKNFSGTFPIGRNTDEYTLWRDFVSDSLKDLSPNIFDICFYGFGEIVNNALDHSGGKKLEIATMRESERILLKIVDNGIGIFRKIQTALNLEDERESILHLSKGKFTTDPEKHTGEGVFFTSRAFDMFCLSSFGLIYFRRKTEDDWFIKSDPKEIEGTEVIMEISPHSKTRMRDVFSEFTSENIEGIPRFDRTHILVELSKLGEERFVSRSQAKRILLGLEKFNHIVLDFKNVSFVGQGFVDEVFRIFHNEHPNITIKYIHANEDVTFMIERGLT